MLRSLAFALGVSAAAGLQLAPAVREMKAIQLDEQEVATRGSRCIDGTAPGFYHKQGTLDGHFVFWLQGGGVCMNKTDCASYPPKAAPSGTMESQPLQDYGVFADYHHVLMPNCDLGLYMGDRTDPVTHNGVTMYFQGSRIVKHVVDVLSANYTLTDVLFAGGSGGGQSIYVGADYFKSVMPSTVKKFGVAPMNGWYAEGGVDELTDLYTLANMETTVPQACKQAFREGERHNCMDPATSYRYLESNVFMVQIFDYTFSWNTTNDVKSSWTECLYQPENKRCTDEDVEILQEYLDNYTQSLKSYPKYKEHGQGGYLSTCTAHTYYNDPEFNTYANNGVTTGAAIEKWWQALGTNPPAVWYLPCTLGKGTKAQCESSC